MKPALHRSITFWSGLLVMGFICWAWQDSWENLSIIGRGDYWLGSNGSGLSILRSTPSPLTDHIFERSNTSGSESLVLPIFLQHAGLEWQSRMVDHYFFKPEGEGEQAPTSLLLTAITGNEGDWILYIPYWVLLAVVAVAWLALLIWRAKRRNRPASAIT